MKEVQFDGPGDRLLVDDIEIVQGGSAEVSDETAARLQADRYVEVTVREITPKTKPAAPNKASAAASPNEQEK